jgi:hypothetical protein
VITGKSSLDDVSGRVYVDSYYGRSADDYLSSLYVRNDMVMIMLMMIFRLGSVTVPSTRISPASGYPGW